MRKMSCGFLCPRCRGTVDSIEFDFLKGICRECVEEMEYLENKKAEARRLMEGEFKQMELEDLMA